jgi:hypothetical protein
MNRLLLIILLIGIGVYLYIILFQQNKITNEKMITDDFTEKLPPNWNKNQQPPIVPLQPNHKNLKVHFSDKVDIKEIETESLDELFLLKPKEVENTNLTMSENEYF